MSSSWSWGDSRVGLIHVGFVTGAGGAVGRATVLQFARDGMLKIAGVDVSAKGLEETSHLLKSQFPAVTFLPLVADITAADEVDSAVAKTVAELGRLDYGINNAGVGQKLSLTHETSPEDFDRVIGVNLRGLWNCERAELQRMMAQEALPSVSGLPGRTMSRGVIVNVDSILGLLAMPQLGLYTTSKHAVVGLTRTDALDYADKGIRVNCICPGLATPQEIADAIAFLCSERASYITGVDGGYTLH
ncbi:NAD(P)-binding protein [Thozetella sp. PMI_491]|nr:NAD(P)-binding protein [Thozetella sp. PMI_491]